MDETEDDEVVIEEVIVEQDPESTMGTEVPEFSSVRDALSWFNDQRVLFAALGIDTGVDMDREGRVSLLVGGEEDEVWAQEFSDLLGLSVTEAGVDMFAWRLVDEDWVSDDD